MWDWNKRKPRVMRLCSLGFLNENFSCDVMVYNAVQNKFIKSFMATDLGPFPIREKYIQSISFVKRGWNAYAHTLICMNVHVHTSSSYGGSGFEIDESTKCASLSTRTSSLIPLPLHPFIVITGDKFVRKSMGIVLEAHFSACLILIELEGLTNYRVTRFWLHIGLWISCVGFHIVMYFSPTLFVIHCLEMPVLIGTHGGKSEIANYV